MGTLKPITPSQPDDIETSIAKLNVVGSAVKYVEGRGMTFPSLDNNFSFRGELPPNYTTLDDGHLGQILGYMSEYCGFVESELSVATVNRNTAEHILDQLRAGLRLYLTSSRGKLTVQDKNDIVESDPRVVDAKASFLYWSSVYALTKTILDRCQRNWDTISRHITQRGQQVDRMVRGNSMSLQPSAGLPHFRR